METTVRHVLPLVLLLVLFGGAAAEESSEDPSAVLSLVDRLVRSTPVRWTEADFEALVEGTSGHPRAVITRLVELLQVDSSVPGEPTESTVHSVCGNALTLLDRLTSENVGGETSDWIGFATRDHRGRSPDAKTVYGPWRAWLEVRKYVPVERWFWGLSFAELARVRPLVRMGEGPWSEEAVAKAHALGRRVYPYLLDKLVDEGWAGEGYRVCDGANALLRRLTGHDLGEIVRHEHMRIDPKSPMRRLEYAIRENQASMRLIQRRWTAFLLTID